MAILNRSFLKKAQVLIIGIFFITHIAGAQQSETLENPTQRQLAKNAAYANLGMVPGVYVMGALNYERLLREGKKESVQSVWLRIGAGGWADWGNAAIVYEATINSITGQGKKHFEYGLGLAYSRGYDINPVPAGNFGYRYQKPTGGLVFRTGVGFPEMIYFSLGYCLGK